MTLGELIESLKCDDYGKPFPLDLPVVFDTDVRFDMELLSVYLDDDGVLHIDVD